MKRFATVLAVTAILFATLSTTQATGCRVVAKKQVVAEKVIVEKVAAVAVPVVAVATVPYYASYYTPPPAPAVNAANVADNGELTNAVKVLVEQMKEFNARLDRIERGSGVPPMQPAEPIPPSKPRPGDPFNPHQGAAPLQQGGVSIAASCIQCHQAGGMGTKGKAGIVLFDAQKRIIPGVEGKMLTSVLQQRMPHKAPFSNEQVLEFIAAMDAHLTAKR